MPPCPSRTPTKRPCRSKPCRAHSRYDTSITCAGGSHRMPRMSSTVMRWSPRLPGVGKVVRQVLERAAVAGAAEPQRQRRPGPRRESFADSTGILQPAIALEADQQRIEPAVLRHVAPTTNSCHTFKKFEDVREAGASTSVPTCGCAFKFAPRPVCSRGERPFR
jgi:hypothetical protein